MTENKSDENSIWGKLVQNMQDSEKSIKQIAREYREAAPEQTQAFKDKTLEDTSVTDILAIFAKEIEPETKLDVNTFRETGEEKYCIYIYLSEEEFDKYYSDDEDRMGKWDDFAEKLTQYFEDYGLAEKRDKAYIHLKRGKT